MADLSLPSRRAFLRAIVEGFLAALIPILIGQVMVRALKIEEFGVFFSSLSLLSLSIYIATLGFDKVLLKVYGDAEVKGIYDFARGIRFVTPLLMLGSSALCVIFFIVAHKLAQDEGILSITLFAMLLLLLPLMAISRYYYSSLMILGHRAMAAFLRKSFPKIIIILLMTGLLLLGHDELMSWKAAAVYIFAYASSLFVLVLFRRRVEPETFRKGDRSYELSSWIRHGLSQSTGFLATVAMGQSAILFSAWVWNSDDDAALLSVAMQVAGGGIFLAAFIAAFYYPAITAAIAAQDRRQIQDVLRSWVIRFCPVSLGLCILILLMKNWLLDLYGFAYYGANSTIILYAICFAISIMLFVPFAISQFLPSRYRLLVMYAVIIFAVAAMFLIDKNSESAVFWLAAVQMSFQITVQLVSIFCGWLNYRTWPRT